VLLPQFKNIKSGSMAEPALFEEDNLFAKKPNPQVPFIKYSV
jgi:hypothetical protein